LGGEHPVEVGAHGLRIVQREQDVMPPAAACREGAGSGAGGDDEGAPPPPTVEGMGAIVHPIPGATRSRPSPAGPGRDSS